MRDDDFRIYRFLFSFSALLLGIFLSGVGCRGYAVATQRFTFPENTDSYGNEWELLCVVRTSTPQSGAFSIKLDRKVTIVVVNKKEQYLLKESLNFHCSDLKAKVNWSNMEKLSITLFEHKASENTDDSYSLKPIYKAVYSYNSHDGEYVKSKGRGVGPSI